MLPSPCRFVQDWLHLSGALQAGLRAKPKLGTRDAMELGIAGARGGALLPRTAAEVADPCWVIDKVLAAWDFQANGVKCWTETFCACRLSLI
jgi:hypothetical protein